ncbi:hypothetical protein [Amaricoccus sp.]|uniref:hypothetical protein n=1 Tax=Amaricoccus sp. TaxID=1872485 RepID=UPI001B6682B3|nr:hypothetical protein [Amaricoccus sp.]MBP7001721.1 hypothetical protein [Amaricoccus sp.]
MRDSQSHILEKIRKESDVLVDSRIEAVKAIWKAHCEAQQLAFYANFLKVLKFEAIGKAIGEAGMKEFAGTIGAGLENEKFVELGRKASGLEYRPFVPERIWDLHTAYNMVMFSAAGTWLLWKIGMDPVKITDTSKMIELVSRVLPTYAAYIEKYKLTALYHLADELDANLVSEMRHLLTGEATDIEAARRASKAMATAQFARSDPAILKAASDLAARYADPDTPQPQ